MTLMVRTMAPSPHSAKTICNECSTKNEVHNSVLSTEVVTSLTSLLIYASNVKIEEGIRDMDAVAGMLKSYRKNG
jgi:hypothetical protein